MQTEIHTAEPLVPASSASDVELSTEKLKRPKKHQEMIKFQQNCFRKGQNNLL
jgi:hypothetical protein